VLNKDKANKLKAAKKATETGDATKQHDGTITYRDGSHLAAAPNASPSPSATTTPPRPTAERVSQQMSSHYMLGSCSRRASQSCRFSTSNSFLLRFGGAKATISRPDIIIWFKAVVLWRLAKMSGQRPRGYFKKKLTDVRNTINYKDGFHRLTRHSSCLQLGTVLLHWHLPLQDQLSSHHLPHNTLTPIAFIPTEQARVCLPLSHFAASFGIMTNPRPPITT
jgi:hypothetical protein